MYEDEVFDEIDEEEQYENELEDKRSGTGCLVKAVTLLILLAFITFSMSNFSYLWSNKLSFLDQNKLLMEDEIVQQCKPAVVSIEAVTSYNFPLTTDRKGTGFNISPTGRIVTNLHIVDNASRIIIRFGDGKQYYAHRYETIPGVDIAIITIEGNNLPTLDLNMNEQLQSGESVTVIGNPIGFEKISQRGKVGQFHQISDSQSQVFDINIPVNPGNSGSPVINNSAQVVGIVFASFNMDIDGESEARALAIPVKFCPLSDWDYTRMR